MHRLAWIVCLASVAHADTKFEIFDGEIEGELSVGNFVPDEDDELAVDRPRETVASRSAMFDSAIHKTRDPRARAALILARADLWAAYVIHERVREQTDIDWLKTLENGALDDYKTIADDATLYDWRPRDGALLRYARVLSMTKPEAGALVYEHLLHDYPKSQYRFVAKLALADFERAQGHPGAALADYRDVAATAPDAKMRAYAFYRQGMVLMDKPIAADAFVAFEQSLAMQPEEMLAREARKGLVRAFSLFGDPGDSFGTFARIGDATEMMDDLADFYLQTSRAPQAVLVTEELLRRNPNHDRICEWQARIVGNVDPLLDGPKRIVDESQRMVDVFHHAQRIGVERIGACRVAAVTFTFDEAGRLAHAARASRDRDYATLADRLYELFLRTMPDDENVPVARRERAQLRAEFP